MLVHHRGEGARDVLVAVGSSRVVTTVIAIITIAGAITIGIAVDDVVLVRGGRSTTSIPWLPLTIATTLGEKDGFPSVQYSSGGASSVEHDRAVCFYKGCGDFH